MSRKRKVKEKSERRLIEGKKWKIFVFQNKLEKEDSLFLFTFSGAID